MRYLAWALRLLLFILLLGFAAKNSEVVSLHYYLGYEWQAPLVLVLMVFFLAGIVIGVVANMLSILRLKREILGLKKELRIKSHANDALQLKDGSATNHGI
ncbi:LapA family protein [Sulfurirhabdus autotrophica]|uniref:Putative integral membrane protein n=1 Tax=Sulfurirhabdus autotrophica TaxID=1706046 RepID=A0A4R3YIM6_9PROT|nr:LapA family protein [Sulfurirhabdus autotrophica]TCV90523.1 putative integral membrane protein [Sulfurirhabdus autotrophica]